MVSSDNDREVMQGALTSFPSSTIPTSNHCQPNGPQAPPIQCVWTKLIQAPTTQFIWTKLIISPSKPTFLLLTSELEAWLSSLTPPAPSPITSKQHHFWLITCESAPFSHLSLLHQATVVFLLSYINSLMSPFNAASTSQPKVFFW